MYFQENQFTVSVMKGIVLKFVSKKRICACSLNCEPYVVQYCLGSGRQDSLIPLKFYNFLIKIIAISFRIAERQLNRFPPPNYVSVFSSFHFAKKN